MTTRRKITGSLIARNGVWYARWKSGKKQYKVSTGIRVGEKGSKDDARKILAERIAPFNIKAEADREAAFAQRAAAAETHAAEVREEEEAEAARIPLADAWERGPYEWSQPNRRKTSIHRLTPRNVRENECAWKKFVRWVEGTQGPGLAMQDITHETAKAYSTHLQAEGLTPSRHNLLLTVAGVMYRIAGLENPFASVPKLTPQQAESREPFTREQVKRLLAAASGEWRGFLAVLYYTGLRAGDAVQLKGEQRTRGKIRVRTSKTGQEVNQLEHRRLREILEEVAPKRKKGYLFPKLAEAYKRNPTYLSQRFVRFAGKVLGEKEEGEEGTKFTAFDMTAERKGGKRRISRYGLHSFRHSFASHAAEGGAPLAMVKKYLGHASEAITSIYAQHATDKEARKLIEALKLDDEESEAETQAGTTPNAANVAAMLAKASPEQLAKVAELLKGE
jgi:integrase